MFLTPCMSYTFTIKQSLKHLLQWLFPATCLVCGLKSCPPRQLCMPCYKTLPYLAATHCSRCASQLHTTALCCGKCLISPPPFSKTFSLFTYQFPIPQLIAALKYQGKLCYAMLFAELLSEKIQSDWYKDSPLPDVLIPIPLHTLRLQERGFNQALVIAKDLSNTLKMSLDYVSLQRQKPTIAQTQLSALERQKNMAGAFFSGRDYNNLTVAVLDDVMTTTQTMRACSQTLIVKGAKAVHVWCVARR